MPQLQINQGPQDALLYDNSRSYFTNVGYVRTSNFQMELRDVDSQNTAKLGSTVQFVIPKAADLLGPVDLVLKMKPATTGAVVASSGPPAVSPTNTHASWVKKFGFACIDQITFSVGSHDIEKITGDQLDIINELMRDDESRYTSIVGNIAEDHSGSTDLSIINASTLVSPGADFIVPLGLFFTKHPSQYFPLAAIAGCNDVRITIRFRQKNDLIYSSDTNVASTADIEAKNVDADIETAQLRCHYIHVTGPEASTLMNKEHVRLLKLWHHDSKVVKDSDTKVSMDLSFLHPVSELIMVLRKNDDFTSGDEDTRDFYTYKGHMTKFQLTLNGQDRHPSLSSGIDKRYIQDRLMPMLHSNTSNNHSNAADSKLLDRKEIIVYPFSLNPEGSNPAGAVNFSKVSHAKLTVELGKDSGGNTMSGDHTLDVYAVYYNWLQIKDGRALTSFA
tara:strand:- start:8887 stop:10227 length:1341 start_codon:yes stop_codon:yes gene_type:complete